MLKPGSLPKTSSGKIQRHACRASFLRDEFGGLATWCASTEPAAGESEELPGSIQVSPDKALIKQWLIDAVASRLRLKPAEIDSTRPVVYYGVDSLIAVDLTHTIETTFGVSLTVPELLQTPSFDKLAALVFDCLTVLAKDIRTQETVTLPETPLSYGQRALWFLHELAPESAAYNISAAARIHSTLDVAALEQSLQKLIVRHPALRTSFPVEAETPVQRVKDFITVNLNQEDTCHLNEAAFSEYLREETIRPFDLSNGPLLRVSLFKRTQKESVLLFVAHHMVADFWSMALLINELATIYQAETTGSTTTLTPLPVNYLDYCRSQAELLAGPEGERLWLYWQKQLSAAQTSAQSTCLPPKTAGANLCRS